MCGRTRLDDDGAAIAEALGATLGVGAEAIAAGEGHPNGRCLVAVHAGGGLRVGPLLWGMPVGRPAPTPGDRRSEATKYVYHARVESLAETPLFREAATRRRGLLPVHRFSEWSTLGEPGRRVETTAAAGGLLLLGVLWGRGRFVIVTRAAEGALAEVHPRMPLVIDPAWIAPWTESAPLPAILPGLLAAAPPLVSAAAPRAQQSLFGDRGNALSGRT